MAVAAAAVAICHLQIHWVREVVLVSKTPFLCGHSKIIIVTVSYFTVITISAITTKGTGYLQTLSQIHKNIHMGQKILGPYHSRMSDIAV